MSARVLNGKGGIGRLDDAPYTRRAVMLMWKMQVKIVMRVMMGVGRTMSRREGVVKIG